MAVRGRAIEEGAGGGATDLQGEPWFAIGPGQAGLIVALWTGALIAINFLAHSTPLYFVETDLIGEYLPAAQELLGGVLNPDRYVYKGPGYSVLLVAFSLLFQGDVGIAAKVLSPMAAGLASWLAYILARRTVGGPVATFVLIGMLVTPIQVRYAIEAGTDAPAMALMLASTCLIVCARRARLRFLAGLLAGCAVLTRGNALFLFPCALFLLALERPRLKVLVAYSTGAALPLLLWAGFAAQAGGLPADRNYLNVAWELYGHGVSWERFEPTIGARFDSMFDVLAYDPLRAGTRILGNLLAHRLEDVRALAFWLGLPAVPGMFLLARSSAGRALLLHGVACCLVLAPVFYNSRFSLYLAPLYLTASGTALAWLASQWSSASTTRSRFMRARSLAAPALGITFLFAAGVAAAFENGQRLLDAPHETRLAGSALARRGLAGRGILSRKPHVAHFAGMRLVALPLDLPLVALPVWAERKGVSYLFYSGIEQNQRPEYGVLADSGLVLPGFEQIFWTTTSRGGFGAVYRLTSVPVDSIGFATAYRQALARYERRHRSSSESLLFLAVQYLRLGDPAEAVARLDRLNRAGAEDAGVERIRCVALRATGDLGGAAAACEKAMTLEPATGWHWAQLGSIRAAQGDPARARDCFAEAVAREPASLEYVKLLGQAQIATRRPAEAAATFERGVKLAPEDVEVRRFAMGAWQLAGNERRMRELYADGVKAGLPAEVPMGAR